MICLGDTASARKCVAINLRIAVAPEAVTPTLGSAYRSADHTHVHHMRSLPGSDKRLRLRKKGFKRA